MTILPVEPHSLLTLTLLGEEPLDAPISQDNLGVNIDLIPSKGMQTNLLSPYERAKSYLAPRQFKTRRAPSYNGSIDAYTFRLNRWLLRLGTDYLNREFHVLGNPLPGSSEPLAEVLLDALLDRAHVQSAYERGMNGKDPQAISERTAEHLATSAAFYALDGWRPDYFTLAAERGRAGGRKSRRQPKYTHADYARVAGLSIAQGAAVLGCSERTISNLRKAHR